MEQWKSEGGSQEGDGGRFGGEYWRESGWSGVCCVQRAVEVVFSQLFIPPSGVTLFNVDLRFVLL